MELMEALTRAEEKLGIVLKEKQREAVLAVLGGRDVFCVLPTGYGKSMVYGILPRAFDILLGEQLIGYGKMYIYQSFVLKDVSMGKVSWSVFLH